MPNIIINIHLTRCEQWLRLANIYSVCKYIAPRLILCSLCVDRSNKVTKFTSLACEFDERFTITRKIYWSLEQDFESAI